MSWTAEDIDWHRFTRDALSPALLPVIKAASMVERNAADYTTYLGNVFRDDPDFLSIIRQWQAEEVQHGDILGRYAELADPDFQFLPRFKRFADGYQIPVHATQSVRGSLAGELLARCIVETGTSSFYSAIRDATDEPVLKQIAHRIAGDEFRHYRLFYDHMRRHAGRDRFGRLRRALVAIGRIRETDDDELAYAYHAANDPLDLPYDRARCNAAYAAAAYRLYRPVHTERAVAMVLKVVGLDPNGWLGRQAKAFAWNKMQARAAL